MGVSDAKTRTNGAWGASPEQAVRCIPGSNSSCDDSNLPAVSSLTAQTAGDEKVLETHI